MTRRYLSFVSFDSLREEMKRLEAAGYSRSPTKGARQSKQFYFGPDESLRGPAQGLMLMWGGED